MLDPVVPDAPAGLVVERGGNRVSSMRVRDLLLKQWPLIAVCILAGALGTAIAGKAIARSAPRYQATAVVEAVIYGSVTDIPGFMTTEAFFADSDSVISRVAPHYPTLTETQIRTEVSASVVSGARLLEIRVTDADPARAASLANDVASALVAMQQEDAQQAGATDALALIQKDIADTKANIDAVSAQLSKAQANGASGTSIQALNDQLASLQSLRSQQELTLQSMELSSRSGTAMLALAERAQVSSAPASSVTTSLAFHVAVGALLGLVLALVIIALRELLWSGDGTNGRRRLGARRATAGMDAPILEDKRVISASAGEPRS
jgi:tyrosine-protein kinase